MSQNSDQIISNLRDNATGLSATAIAHALGFSKATSIKKDLDELVNNGQVEIDSSGRYELYKLVAKVQKSEKAQEKVTIVEGEKSVTTLPEASSNDLRGYSISSIIVKDKKTNKDKKMKKIVTPDGKKIRMENEENLLVINNEPKYIVKTPTEVMSCIRKYASDKSYNVFTVSDIKQNKKISNDKDVEVKDDHIIFLTIQKHNKAA